MADLLWVCEGQSVHDGAWIVDHPRGYQIRIPKHMDFLPLVEELNHAALRAQLAEAEERADGLGAWECAECGARFAQKVNPVLLDGVRRCSSCVRADAAESALAASESKRKVLADALRMCEFGETVGVDGPGFCPVCCGRGRHSADGCVVADALSASGVEVLARGFCPPNPDSGVAVIIRPAPVTAEWTPCLIIRTDAANALEEPR